MDGACGRQYVESDLDARKARRTRRGESCQNGSPEKWKGDLADLNAFASQHRICSTQLYSGSRNERNKVDILGQLAYVGSEYKLTVEQNIYTCRDAVTCRLDRGSRVAQEDDVLYAKPHYIDDLEGYYEC